MIKWIYTDCESADYRELDDRPAWMIKWMVFIQGILIIGTKAFRF